MGKPRLTAQQIAAADQGEARALAMLQQAIATYVKTRRAPFNATHSEALLVIVVGLEQSLADGAGSNITSMLAAAIAVLGENEIEKGPLDG